MKHLIQLTILVLFSVGLMAQPNTNRHIRNLQAAPDTLMFPISTKFKRGKYFLQYDYISNYRTKINPVPQVSPPAPSGNTDIDQFVRITNGDIYFIGADSTSIKIYDASGGGVDTDVSFFGLNPSSDSLLLIEDATRYAIATADIDSNHFYHVLQDTITQTAHGFILDNGQTPFLPIRYNKNNSVWETASTSAAADLPWTYIVEIIDANTFITQPLGPIWNKSHTLNVGDWLFLQDDGSYNSTSPDSDYDVVVCAIYQSNTIWLVDNRPMATGGGNNLNIVNARNGVGMNGDTIEFGFPLIRHTQVNGNGFAMRWENMGPYTVESTANVDVYSGSTSEINLNGGVGLHLNSPSVYIDQRPPSSNMPLLMVWDSTNQKISLRRDIDLPYSSMSLLANQALSISNDTIQFGRSTRESAQEFFGGRYVTPRDTNSYFEFWDDATVGQFRYPMRFVSGNTFENGAFGIYFEDTLSNGSGHIGIGNLVLKIDGSNGVNLTIQKDTRFQVSSLFNRTYQPLVFSNFDLTGFSIPRGTGAFVVSDGTISGTIAGEAYYGTDSENYIPISIQYYSDMLLPASQSIAFGQTDWAWTVPPAFDGYRLIGVEHSFVSAGDNDVTLAIELNSIPIGLYNVILTANTRLASIYPTVGVITLSAGDVIRGRLPSGPVGTPAAGWSINMALDKL